MCVALVPLSNTPGPLETSNWPPIFWKKVERERSSFIFGRDPAEAIHLSHRSGSCLVAAKLSLKRLSHEGVVVSCMTSA